MFWKKKKKKTKICCNVRIPALGCNRGQKFMSINWPCFMGVNLSTVNQSWVCELMYVEEGRQLCPLNVLCCLVKLLEKMQLAGFMCSRESMCWYTWLVGCVIGQSEWEFYNGQIRRGKITTEGEKLLIHSFPGVLNGWSHDGAMILFFPSLRLQLLLRDRQVFPS